MNLEKTIRTEAVAELFKALQSLQSEEEYYLFFEDMCTANEVHSIAQRFQVARMLHEGKTYMEVAAETGASTATISRVNRVLNYGTGSCDIIFERIRQTEEKQDE